MELLYVLLAGVVIIGCFSVFMIVKFDKIMQEKELLKKEDSKEKD